MGKIEVVDWTMRERTGLKHKGDEGQGGPDEIITGNSQ